VETLKLSNSKVTTWRKCHKAYYYKYGLKLRPKKKGIALRRGSIIHECIEAYDSGRSWRKPYRNFAKQFYEETFKEEIVEMGDIPRMVEELMENYQALYENDGLIYLGNELHFELPLMPGVVIEGYLDALVEDEKGAIWPKETKTYKRNPDYDFLLLNTQSALYTWAVTEMGYSPKGTLWDIIRAKEPGRPQFLKDGKVSKRGIDSTPYTVKKALREMGQNPEDYEDLLAKVSYEDYFRRYPVRVNPTVVKGIMDDFKSTAREIMKSGDKLHDRNLGKGCAWCDYKPLCQADLMGLDTEFIQKKQFEVVEKEGRPDGNEEENP
jgi:hypothetical protein